MHARDLAQILYRLLTLTLPTLVTLRIRWACWSCAVSTVDGTKSRLCISFEILCKINFNLTAIQKEIIINNTYLFQALMVFTFQRYTFSLQPINLFSTTLTLASYTHNYQIMRMFRYVRGYTLSDDLI